LVKIIHNPVYKGVSVLASRRGRVERPAPALVAADVWEAAQEALIRNRKLAKRNAKHEYLLRGLIRCGHCGSGYAGKTVGSGGSTKVYPFYICNGAKGVMHPLPENRCRSKTVAAAKLDAHIWQHCRRWAYDPGDALGDAQRELRERMAQTVGAEEQRRRLLMEIAEKETERERVLTMYRRGRITTDEADAQLDAIAHETATLREMLESMRAREALVQAQEAHLADAAVMLRSLRDRIEEIERTGDVAAMREVVSLLVRRVVIETEGEGRRRQATARIVFAFSPSRTASLENPTVLLLRSGAGTPAPSWG
jgi:site-specific DNA recombinase